MEKSFIKHGRPTTIRLMAHGACIFSRDAKRSPERSPDIYIYIYRVVSKIRWFTVQRPATTVDFRL